MRSGSLGGGGGGMTGRDAPLTHVSDDASDRRLHLDAHRAAVEASAAVRPRATLELAVHTNHFLYNGDTLKAN